MALYLFHGQEEFLIEKDIGKLKDKLLDKSFIAMNFKTYTNPDFPDLIDILGTQPMMFGNSLIVINCSDYFDSKAESTFDDKQLAQLEKALQNVPEKISIIFLCIFDRNVTKKIDTRKKLYKIFAKYCTVTEYKQVPSYDRTLPATVTKLGKENELFVSTDCAAKLVEMLGSNLRVIDSELKKLKLSIYPETKPQPSDVERFCTSTRDVFKLVDYFILGQKEKSMKEFSLLTQTQHPLQILALLQNTVSRFITLKLLSRDLNSFEISKKVNMHEYRVKLELEKIRNYRYDDLLSLKNNITNCEFKMKTGQTYNEEIAVEQILLSAKRAE